MSAPRDNNKPSACRRLFADSSSNNSAICDAEVAREDNACNAYMERLTSNAQRLQATERWNFDFETETPLEGAWEWEKVEPEPVIVPQEPRQRLQAEIGNVQSEEHGENHSL